LAAAPNHPPCPAPSYKEKRSNYAPPVETPVRYDGVYRILRCWRKKGAQGYLMCR
jgi:E3 ubiquitin-protein ligase UHRF1